jgi:hypothetical protein
MDRGRRFVEIMYLMAGFEKRSPVLSNARARSGTTYMTSVE